jgi:hypothetical protein
MAITHYTYFVLKMPAPNGVLSVYGYLTVSFKFDNETLNITATNACADALAVTVAPSDLTIPENKHTDTTLDATLSTKKVCLGLVDPEKRVVIGDNLKEK